MKTKIVGVLAMVFLLACVGAAFEGYGQSKPKEIQGQKMEKSRGESKYQLPTGDQPVPKPTKSRGACCLAFDNNTGYYIDIWLDNVYQGRLSPWDSSYSLCVGSGYTTYHCETVGAGFAWGDAVDCTGSWKLSLK